MRLGEIARTRPFVDGRITNPHSRVKANLQLDYKDPAYAESSRLLAQALQRNETFRNAAFPRVMAPPMLTRYRLGPAYGLHSAAAFLPIGARTSPAPSSSRLQRPMRAASSVCSSAPTPHA